MFQRKIGKMFQGLPNTFAIVDDILVLGFNGMGRDHDDTLDKVLRICRQAKLKLNKDKCLFWCKSIPFFREVILLSAVCLDTRKVQALTTMTPLKCKNELQLFLGIVNYLSMFLPMKTEVCEPLRKHTSVKTKQTWNSMYQELCDKVKNIIKQDACMKF